MGKVKNFLKKKVTWTAPAEDILCELWLENIGRLRSVRKNSHIFQDMAAEMAKRGFVFSSEEVHMKINNLMGKYRKEKLNVSEPDGPPSEWPLFYTVRAILEHYKGRSTESRPPLRVEPREEKMETPIDSYPYDHHIAMGSPTETKFDISSSSNFDISSIPNMPKASEAPVFPIILSSANSTPARTPAAQLPENRPEKLNIRDATQVNILAELKRANELKVEQMKQERENQERIHADAARMVAVEERRNDLLQELIKESRLFHNLLLTCLEKK